MYNKDMKLKVYSWIEFLIWLIIVFICIFAYKYHKYKELKALPTYQIFMPDVDGMIVGSPVKYMGVQVGYIKTIKLLHDNAYVRFVITEDNLTLPQGVIATVEFSGLGGSKSLELYPPDENEHTDNLIVVKKPQRLNDSAKLLGIMYEKIDSISLKFTSFGNKMGVIQENSMEIDPDSMGQNIRQANEFADNLIKTRENFIKRMKGGKDEQCESNQ